MLGNEETIAALSNNLTEAGGVAALSVKGNFIFDAATHRDFLGALLGTGIEREKASGHILSCLWSISGACFVHALALLAGVLV